MHDEVFERVRRVAGDVFNASELEITLDASPGTLEKWDSGGHVNFILGLESEFGINFLPTEIAETLDIRMALQYVIEKISKDSDG